MISTIPRTDALAAVQDELLLLRTGRSSRALRDLREQSSCAHQRGRSEGETAAAQRLRSPRPRQVAPPPEQRLDWLRGLLADPVTRASVREVLRLDDRMLDRLAAGAVTLSPQMWRRLRDALK